MIAIPLVLFAVINAVGALHGQKSIAALAGRTFAWFAITAVLAVAVGLAVGWIVKPGVGVGALAIASDYTPKNVPGPLDVLLNIVPQNPFRALSATAAGKTADGMNVIVPSNSTILQVIFFAGLIGFAFVKLGEKAANLRTLAREANDTMIQVTRFVLEFTPLGTFGLIAGLVGAYGFEKLLPLGNFVIALFIACIVQIVVVYGALLLAHGLNPLKFFRGAAPGDAGGLRRFQQFRGDAGFAARGGAQPRCRQGLRGVRGAAGREHQDGRVRCDLSGAGGGVHRAVFGHRVARGHVRHDRVGVGARQFRHGGRSGHGGDHGDGGVERRGVAVGGDRLSVRDRSGARHDAHDDQRHRADVGAGVGGEGDGVAGSHGVRGGIEQRRRWSTRREPS